MIDHGPAWALIPWYGDDGLGAPTLDDWRVWADWLRAHDPDDERDAEITRALDCGWSDEVVAVRCARACLDAGRHPASPPAAPRVRPRYIGREFIGFEVQPTRREMHFRAMLGFTHAATIEGDRWVNIPTPANARQPRNPRRRGSTGAHGRARR